MTKVTFYFTSGESLLVWYDGPIEEVRGEINNNLTKYDIFNLYYNGSYFMIFRNQITHVAIGEV